jgi:hypothetical protein
MVWGALQYLAHGKIIILIAVSYVEAAFALSTLSRAQGEKTVYRWKQGVGGTLKIMNTLLLRPSDV